MASITLTGILVPPFGGINKRMKHRCGVHSDGSFQRGTSLSVEEKMIRRSKSKYEELGALWEDGYGSQSVQDYFDAAKDVIVCDGGPPRWFSPLPCGTPLKDSPILLFLPGIVFQWILFH